MKKCWRVSVAHSPRGSGEDGAATTPSALGIRINKQLVADVSVYECVRSALWTADGFRSTPCS